MSLRSVRAYLPDYGSTRETTTRILSFHPDGKL